MMPTNDVCVTVHVATVFYCSLSRSCTGTGSPRRQRQRKTLEQQTAITPSQISESSQSGLDSVSLQSAGSSGSGHHDTNSEEKGLINDRSTVTKGLNGEVRSLSDSSGINSYTETPNEKVRVHHIYIHVP